MMMTKLMQWMATMTFVVGGILLPCAPSQAQVKAAAPTRFTVVDEGTKGKPDVVLVPGLTSSRKVWAGEAELLAPNYRLHLMQLNGFAGQPAGPNATGEILPAIVDEMHAYCETLRAKPVVIGHSLGGLLALMLAAKYPADVTKIVIVDSLPFLGMMFGPQITPATIKPQAEQMRDKLEQQDADKQKASAKQTAEKLVLNPEGRTLVENNSEDSDTHVVAEAMYEDLQTDMRQGLAEIKAPALMLYPFDPTLKVSGAAATRDVDELYQGAYKSMPNVTTVRVDGSRHFIMLDQPEKMDGLVEAFLKQ
ncbi:MAG TPA: alpha/beta hydrolase [Terriglobales bacterium]|jgi:pimeloyl-ACP methyl ester carboxylesterase|nr:alpha/beta hydrolase [Terriglobales bacterium]